MPHTTVRFDSIADAYAWAHRREQRQPRTPRLVLSEHEEQVRLIAWVRASLKTYPQLQLLYAVPNGMARSKATAGKLRAEGVLPGVSDLCLPLPRRGAHALYLELKALDGHPSDAQLWFAREVAAEGSIVAFAWGWDMARETLVWYLTGS